MTEKLLTKRRFKDGDNAAPPLGGRDISPPMHLTSARPMFTVRHLARVAVLQEKISGAG